MTAKFSKNRLPKAEEAVSKSFNHATPPPYETSPYSSNFAVVSFNMADRVRLIQFPAADIDRIRDLVRLAWPDGVQNTRTYNVAYEFKLKGTPWHHNAHGNVKARNFVRMLLQGLYEMGWVHDSAVTFSKKPNEKDTLVFRKHDEPMPPTEFFTITLDQMHIITMHEAPPEVSQQLIQRFRQANWTKESVFIEDRIEIRLKELYWLANGEKTVEVRMMLLAMVETLEQFGFRIYASMRAMNREGGEPDSLICCRRRGEEQDHSARDVEDARLVDL